MRNLTQNELTCLSGSTISCPKEEAPYVAGFMIGGIIGIAVGITAMDGSFKPQVIGMIAGPFVAHYMDKYFYPECSAKA